AIRSAREPVDTANPTGSILFYMLASYAEWERATIRERTLSGKIKRAQQGKNPGFVPPYGYCKALRPGEWQVAEEEAVIVRRIFREYCAGRGADLIARGLNGDGIRPRKAARFDGVWVSRLLQNPVYTGVLRYGLSTRATRAQRLQGAGARVRFDAPRYACVAGAVPPIISAEEFAQAQRVRAGRSSTAGFRNRGAAFLLTGIARCRCGAPLRGDGREKSGAGRYYRCSGIRAGQPDRCRSALMPASPLETAVLEQVRKALTPAGQDLLLTGWQEEARAERDRVLSELQRAQTALGRLGKSRAKMTADYRAGELPARLFAAQMADLDREEGALKAAAQALATSLERISSTGAEPACPAGALPPLDPWQALSAEEQKQVLRYAVARCVAYRAPCRGPGAGAGPIEVDLQLRRAGAS
ncbi:MAG TPA: recombinase family protein, partial [Symbiobacteriaceae bacterium]|nr:recombinase family protein [Symbiobacteriaceae bacterium]